MFRHLPHYEFQTVGVKPRLRRRCFAFAAFALPLGLGILGSFLMKSEFKMDQMKPIP